MPRIEPLANPSGKAAELLSMVEKKMGRVPNMMKTLAKAPAALEMYLSMSGALGGSSVSMADRERIALLAAEKNSCGYCAKAHAAIGKMAGLKDSDITEARSGKATTSPKSAVLLALAGKILSTNGNLTDSDVQTARAAGVSEQEMFEVVAITSLNIFTNYVNHLADPVVDF